MFWNRSNSTNVIQRIHIRRTCTHLLYTISTTSTYRSQAAFFTRIHPSNCFAWLQQAIHTAVSVCTVIGYFLIKGFQNFKNDKNCNIFSVRKTKPVQPKQKMLTLGHSRVDRRICQLHTTNLRHKYSMCYTDLPV